MIDKNLVTSLELSKRLAKLMEEKGLEVETVFCWIQCEDSNEFRITTKGEVDRLRHEDGVRGDTGELHKYFPAWLSGELGERLKDKYSMPQYGVITKEWGCDEDYPTIPHPIGEKTESEARGLLYEYLLKNNLIK